MQPQRWGDFVTVEALSETSLGPLFKAVNLEGDPQLHYLKVLPAEVASCAPAFSLLDAYSARFSKLRDLYTLRWEGIALAEGRPLAYFEYRQGRLLSEVLDRCGREGIPIAPDQAVYLAERIAGALLSLSTQDQYLGALSPEEILVTFEGEVKLFPAVARDLSTTDLRGSGVLNRMLAYQSEEVREGKKAKPAADRFALGALFFEFLNHQPLRPEGGEVDVPGRVAEAQRGLGMNDPLPPSLGAIVEKALVPEAPGAYATIDAFKTDLDKLITSGEYSPSTFNMAFLMHTLFRDEDEREAQKDRELLALDRTPFLPPPQAPEKPKPKRRAFVPPQSVDASASEPSFTVAEEPSKKGLWISLSVTGVLVVIAVLSYLAFGRKTGPTQEEIDAQIQTRVAQERANILKEQQDLAGKLEAAQKEKDSLAQQATQAKTAEERARAQKALEETQRMIEAQQKQAAALEKKATEAATRPTSTPASTPASTPVEATKTNPPTTPPPAAPAGTEPPVSAPAEPSTETPAAPAPAAEAAVKAGDFVEAFALDVKPKELKPIEVEFTPQARQNRLQGTIYVEVNVDERGAVTGARVVRAPKPDYGMSQAVVAAALKLKYTPAIKSGVPVKTKVTFPVRLEIK